MERSEEESLFYHVTPAKANVIPANLSAEALAKEEAGIKTT